MAFKLGQSGNPAGRKRGTRNKATRLRESLTKDLPALLDATKAAALNGDMVAMRLLLERTIPSLRPSQPPVAVPGLEEAQTLTEKAKSVVAAVGRGELPPDTGVTLLVGLGHLAKVVEVDELVRRIAELEAIINGKAD